jgi:hypothetical protein
MQACRLAAVAQLGSALQGTILHGGCVSPNAQHEGSKSMSVDQGIFIHAGAAVMTRLVGTATAD